MDEHLVARLERIFSALERMRLDEYVEYVSNRKRMIFNNIFYGILRGLGFSFGFTILGAVGVVIIKHLVVENVPLIGDFLAEVINAIQERI